MSTRGTFIEGGCVHLDDVNGFPATIPTTAVRHVMQAAKNADNEKAKWADRHGTRWFNRDALIGAVNLLDQADQCTRELCEDAAVFDLANKRPRCDPHKD